MFCKSYQILSNIFSKVSIEVFLGKTSVNKEGGKEDNEVNLNEVNVTLESVLDKWTEVRFETGPVKSRKCLFGAILFLKIEVVFDFSIKDISLSVLIAFYSPLFTA